LKGNVGLDAFVNTLCVVSSSIMQGLQWQKQAAIGLTAKKRRRRKSGMVTKGQKSAKLPARPKRSGLAPISRNVQPIKLDTTHLEEPVHHRWLMTTCLAGAATTLILGGLMLGLFGQSAVPLEANAAINKSEDKIELSQKNGGQLGNDLTTASAPANSKSEILPQRELTGNWAYPEITESELDYSADDTAVLDSEIEAVEAEQENITEISKSAPPEPVDESFKVARGGDLKRALIDRGVSKAAAEELVRAIEPVLPISMIKPGTNFDVTFDRQIDFYGREVIFPVEMTFKPGPKETILVSADEDGNFEARVSGKNEGAKSAYARVDHYRAKSQIGSSLYSTAKDNKIPEYIVSEFTRVFSYDVDFQHQIEASDDFEMLFGKPLTGTSTKRKVLHYAQLNFGGKTKRYFRFTTADGQTDYFDENGRSASRALLKTPISGAKLTSGFGMRRHPLLRYSKMHTGVDFGAPTGTPIRAAGSGVVDLAGRHGAYGNTIVLKHGEKYKTLYAHMSRLATGIRKGKRVNQGQVIGYVGSTGRSTGPHLHYEIRITDRPVNPSAIKAAGGKQLAGRDLQNFRVLKNKVVAMMRQAPSSTQLAQAGP
jgi:murein DD-endopeptidase MepM/ murein hydrolase activator NlpD